MTEVVNVIIPEKEMKETKEISDKVNNEKEISGDIMLDNLNKSTIYANNLRVANEMMKNVGQFDPYEHLKDIKAFSACVCARRRSGKSVLVKDICYHMKDEYDNVYVFSPTAEFQQDLFDFVESDKIYNQYTEEAIQKIWDAQAIRVKKLEKQGVEKKDMPHTLLILDDLIAEPHVKNSPMLKKLYVSARHVCIAIIFITQHFTSVATFNRGNLDLACAFFLESQDNREAYAKSYLSTKNKNIGMMIFDNVTKEQDYQAICVLPNLINPNDPTAHIKKYVANDKIKKFKMRRKSVKNYGFFPDPQDHKNVRDVNMNEITIKIKPKESKLTSRKKKE